MVTSHCVIGKWQWREYTCLYFFSLYFFMKVLKHTHSYLMINLSYIDLFIYIHSGPKGRDAGLALSFPIGCLIAHALNGQTEANESIEVFINGFIDAYLARMAEAGKSSEEVAAILRNVIGWSGWFQYLAFYILNVQMESFPCETEEKIGRLRDANGILGLKFLQLSYDTDYLSASAGIDDIRKKFDSLIEEEVTRGQDLFASFRRKKQPRKSSMLRASNRRLSDTEMLFLAAESVRRLSIAEDAKA